MIQERVLEVDHCGLNYQGEQYPLTRVKALVGETQDLGDSTNARQPFGALGLHLAGQERVFTSKTAEGACCTLNGALNAQAKGLATVFQQMPLEDVPYWREVVF
jgi:hypothetical protein